MVWEENEFWLELTWRIDPDGSLGIRQYAEMSQKNPGTRLESMNTTGGSLRTRCLVYRRKRRRRT